MDYTGTKREGGDEESVEHLFMRQVAAEFIDRYQPTDFHGPRGTTAAPHRHEVVRNWRLAGYRFACHLLPTKRVRAPVELDSFIQGLRQRLREYEFDHLGASESGIEVVEDFDKEASEKIETKAQKYLKLATHLATPSHEAGSAALHIARMVMSGDLAPLLSFERVHHAMSKLSRLDEAFEVMRGKNPLQHLYGPREQRQSGE